MGDTIARAPSADYGLMDGKTGVVVELTSPDAESCNVSVATLRVLKKGDTVYSKTVLLPGPVGSRIPATFDVSLFTAREHRLVRRAGE